MDRKVAGGGSGVWRGHGRAHPLTGWWSAMRSQDHGGRALARAQVEVNYVFRGTMRYAMQGHGVDLVAGDLTRSSGAGCRIEWWIPARTRSLSPSICRSSTSSGCGWPRRSSTAMQGATLVASADDAGREGSAFRRWVDYLCSDDPLRIGHAIDEIPARIERIRFAPTTGCSGRRRQARARAPDREPSRASGGSAPSSPRTSAGHLFHRHRALSRHPPEIRDESVFKEVDRHDAEQYVSLLRLSHARRSSCARMRACWRWRWSRASARSPPSTSVSQDLGMSPNHFRREHRADPLA